MKNKDYKQVFELNTPAGSNEAFINQIKQNSARVRMKSPMPALAAAMLIMILGGAVALGVFSDDDRGENIADPARGGATDASEPEKTDEPADAGQPEGLQLVGSSHEGFEVRINAMRGDEYGFEFDLWLTPAEGRRFDEFPMPGSRDFADNSEANLQNGCWCDTDCGGNPDCENIPDGLERLERPEPWIWWMHVPSIDPSALMLDFNTSGVEFGGIADDGTVRLRMTFDTYCDRNGGVSILGEEFIISLVVALENDELCEYNNIWNYRATFVTDYEPMDDFPRMTSAGDAIVEHEVSDMTPGIEGMPVMPGGARW
jgi:hypothetical protein